MTDVELIKYYKRKTTIIVALSLIPIIFIPISSIFFATSSKASLWIMVAIAVVMLIVLGIYFIKEQNEIEMILKNELDPQKYYRVVHGANVVSKYRTEDIQVAYFIGDYASAIGLINEQFTKTKAKGIIAEYNLLLSYCYFETGQFDKLLPLINDLKAYAAEFKKEVFYKNIYICFADFYESFISGNYEKCGDISNLLAPENEKFISNSFKMRIAFYKALALYSADKKSEAKPFFEECYYGCPKFNYSVLSKKYLDIISSGKTVEYAELTPQVGEYVAISPVNQPQKLTIKQKIALGICAILLVGGFGGAFLEDGGSSITGYKTPIDAICEYVDAEEVLTEIPIDENNSLYVYSIGYEYIGVAAVENNNGKYICNVDLSYTIKQWVAFDEYGFGLANIDKEIYYNITDDKGDVSSSSVSSDFEYNGEIYYIYITSVEDNNTWFYSAW